MIIRNKLKVSLLLITVVINYFAYSDVLDEAIANGMLFPTSNQCRDYVREDGSTYTSFSNVFFSTNNVSNWLPVNLPYEEDVFQIEMKHNDNNKNKTWFLRLGKGGQITSFRGVAFGEAMANQANPKAIWNDLVQQTVSVHTALNKKENQYFIHGSGTYAKDEGMPPAFYNPVVAMDCSGNQCIFVNWGQQAHIPTTYRSDVLYYTRYRDCGDGIIEYDQATYHFGLGDDDKLNWMNTPWTGIRTSTFRDMLVASPNGKLQHFFPMARFGGPDEVMTDLDSTGGFTTFAEDLILTDDTFTYPFCIEKDYSSIPVTCVENVYQNERNRCADVSCAGPTECMCKKNGLLPFNLVVQSDNSAFARNVPSSGSTTVEIMLSVCSLNAPITNGFLPKTPILFTNKRTGFTIEVSKVRHWCWGGKSMYFEPNNLMSADIYNREFRKGDEIMIRYKDGTAYNHNFCIETNVPELKMELNCVENKNQNENNRCANVFCGQNGQPSCECKAEDGMEPMKLIMQENDRIETRVGAYGYIEALLHSCSLEAPVRHSCEWCGNAGDGLYFINKRTGYTIEVIQVTAWCWAGEKTIITPNVTDANELNRQFRKGDEIIIRYKPDGKPYDSNLALTFVHGTNPEYQSESYYNAKSRARVGIASIQRDGTVWTTNFLGNVYAQETYFNRKYMIIGNLKDAENEAMPLVSETFEDISKIEELNPGEKVTLYYNNGFFGASIGDDNNNDCSSVTSIFTRACIGSTTPKVGSPPLFHITCGVSKSYVGHDVYVFSPKTTPYLKPYLCNEEDITKRPSYKLLGYFPTNSCSAIGTSRLYDAELCSTNLPTQNPTLQPTKTPTKTPTPIPTFITTPLPVPEPSDSPILFSPITSPPTPPPLICPEETRDLPTYKCLLSIPNQVVGEECALCKVDIDCNGDMVCTGPTNHHGIYYCIAPFETELNCRCYRKRDCLNSNLNVRCRVPPDGTPEEKYCIETKYTSGSILRRNK